MTPQEYTLWLDGFLSNNQSELNQSQTQQIKDKLATVFNKVTPTISVSNIFTSEARIHPDINGYIPITNSPIITC